MSRSGRPDRNQRTSSSYSGQHMQQQQCSQQTQQVAPSMSSQIAHQPPSNVSNVGPFDDFVMSFPEDEYSRATQTMPRLPVSGDLGGDFNWTIEDVDRSSGRYMESAYNAIPSSFDFDLDPEQPSRASYDFDQQFMAQGLTGGVPSGDQHMNTQWLPQTHPDQAPFSSDLEPFPNLQRITNHPLDTSMTEEPSSYTSIDPLTNQYNQSGQMTASQGRVAPNRRRSTSRKRKQSTDDNSAFEDYPTSPGAKITSRPSSRTRSVGNQDELNFRSPHRQSTLGPYGPVDPALGVTRQRSQSDLTRRHSGVSSLDTSSAYEYFSSPDTPSLALSGNDEDTSQMLDATRRPSLQIPSSGHPQDLKNHVMLMTPHAEPYLLERVCKEQLKRYQRLLDWKSKHEEAVSTGSCSSDAQCNLLGRPVLLKPAAKASGSGPQVTFIIDQSEMPEAKPTGAKDHRFEKAQFPEGIPQPPVRSLPAKFECTLCFKVKQFDKPSDWTKHVHEDVQPFTCTFPCVDAKSFKRKADWLRHENERHRQLEKWVCSVDSCAHVCHRKDNFVQHLIREHRLPEPRNRATSSRNEITDPVIARLVVECREDTGHDATSEPCRFCGEVLSDWKKLTAHMSKHMEQISLPLIELINQIVPNSVPPIQPVTRASTWASSTATNRKDSISDNIQPVSRTKSFGPDVSGPSHGHRRHSSRDESRRDSTQRQRSSSTLSAQASLLAPPQSSTSIDQLDSPMSDHMPGIYSPISPILHSPDVHNPSQNTWPTQVSPFTASPVDTGVMDWEVDTDMADTNFSYDPSYDQGTGNSTTTTSFPMATAFPSAAFSESIQQRTQRPESGSRSSSDGAKHSSSKGKKSSAAGASSSSRRSTHESSSRRQSGRR